MSIVETNFTFVRRTPIVSISDPACVSAVEVPGVVVGEDCSVTLVDHVLDRRVLKRYFVSILRLETLKTVLKIMLIIDVSGNTVYEHFVTIGDSRMKF